MVEMDSFQSDLEKLEGLPVAPFMDRDKVTKPSSQVGFIKFVLLPLFEALGSLFPKVEVTGFLFTKSFGSVFVHGEYLTMVILFFSTHSLCNLLSFGYDTNYLIFQLFLWLRLGREGRKKDVCFLVTAWRLTSFYLKG